MFCAIRVCAWVQLPDLNEKSKLNEHSYTSDYSE